MAAPRLRFGDCELCRQSHLLWHRGQPRKIRRKAFEVLLLLIDQRPQTLGHERIAREVWGSKSNAARNVARAVMEARCEIGDDADAPRFILSVRGVGYRFAADVTLAEVGVETGHEDAAGGARAALADIDAAAACMGRGDYQEARRLVDRAIATADLAGARPELARAMALAASVLLVAGSHGHALTLATKAMRLAQGEGRSDVLAHAHIGLGQVQLWTGSAHAALDHLQAAHAVLVAQGPSLELQRCERVLCDTYRRIGRTEEAWQWCERAEALALQLDPESRAISERLHKVTVLANWLAESEAEGRQDDTNRHGLSCLELLDAIEPDAQALGSQMFEIGCLSYRVYILELMGRVEEAWKVVERLRPFLFAAHVTPTDWLEMRRNEFRKAEAGLLSRSGRSVEAMEAIETCITLATNLSEWSMELAGAQGLAAKIYARAGRYPEAIEWLHRQQRTNAKLHADRAQATADIMRAQLESDRLGDELAQARGEVQRLTQLNRELERRILHMARHPLLDEGGLASAGALAATIDGRAALARARELPLCIGIVETFAAADEDGVECSVALRRQLKLLSGTLRAVIPDASAAALWRPGLYFFIIPDMGLGPARELCRVLAQRLNADLVPTTTPDPALSFRADALDVTQFAGIESALGDVPSVIRSRSAVD